MRNYWKRLAILTFFAVLYALIYFNLSEIAGYIGKVPAFILLFSVLSILLWMPYGRGLDWIENLRFSENESPFIKEVRELRERAMREDEERIKRYEEEKDN